MLADREQSEQLCSSISSSSSLSSGGTVCHEGSCPSGGELPGDEAEERRQLTESGQFTQCEHCGVLVHRLLSPHACASA
jgi:hypothetical protein